MRARSRGLSARSGPPKWLRYVPNPASSRTRVDAGEVQVICCTRVGCPQVVDAASGDVVALPPSSQSRQNRCSSQNKLNLFREVGWTVSRRLPFFHSPELMA